MARVFITESLFKEIQKKFNNAEDKSIIDLLESVETNPQKGKLLSTVGGVAVKELRYQKFRFYFITDGHKLKFGTAEELAMLLIKFVKMSDKKDQQKNIENIKDVLKSMGFEGF